MTDNTGIHVRDLDGLRTLAVGAVMMYHFGLPLYGGFIGVDAFFVLSGFLITGLLLRDIDQYGTIQLSRFWVRRMRRLIPAAVLVVVTVTCYLVIGAPLYRSLTLWDSISATLAYVANWHFIASSSYFASTGDQDPLLHMWSLAVEEQFYLVWPLVMLALSRIRSTTVRRRTSQVLIVGIIVASATTFALLWRSGLIDRAYMGTDTRAFQLAIGALVAVSAGWLRATLASRSMRNLTVTAGLVGLAVAAVTVGNSAGATAWYGLGGGLAVGVFAAAAVAGCSVGLTWFSPILGSRPMVYCGQLSYGMYLWHWPLVVLLGDALTIGAGHIAALVKAALLTIATIAAASVSYHFVEVPLRYRGPLVRWPSRQVLVTVPCAMLLVAGLCAGLLTLKERTSGPVVVLVGDSVPKRALATFATIGQQEGLDVISAAYGWCAAVTTPLQAPDGTEFGSVKSCTTTAQESQVSMVRRFNPEAIVWWSRYELSDFLSSQQQHLSPDQEQFWVELSLRFEKRADELTGGTRRLVLVGIEPIGVSVAKRCPDGLRAATCNWFLQRLSLPENDWIRVRWNTVLQQYAAAHANTRYVDLTNLVCLDQNIPCNDEVRKNSYQRPDGVHYTREAAEPVVARILAEI